MEVLPGVTKAPWGMSTPKALPFYYFRRLNGIFLKLLAVDSLKKKKSSVQQSVSTA